MANLVLAERITAEESRIFLLSESRLKQEIAEQQSCKEHFESVKRGFVWRRHDNTIDIPIDAFNTGYLRTTHPNKNYAFIPIISIESVLGVSMKKDITAILQKLNISGEEENNFAEMHLKTAFEKVLGYKTVSGDIYFVQFTCTDKRYSKKCETLKTESILFLSYPDAPPFIDEKGLICCNNGVHIPRNLYGSEEIPLHDLHYNQDERRDIALKGELTIKHVGTLTMCQNAFHKFSMHENFWWAQLGLLYDKGYEKDRTHLF